MAPPEDSEVVDASLVAAAQGGDVRAVESLIVRHEAKVLRVLRFLGVPRRDREDVAQEVFLRVFKHLRRIDPAKPFAGWIYRVTVNAAQDYRVRAVRDGRGDRPLAEGFEAADVSPGPEEIAREAGLRRRLEGALAHLSERERAVFILKELEGLDTPEIARALGVARITVRRHLGLARRRLKSLLARSEEKKPADR